MVIQPMNENEDGLSDNSICLQGSVLLTNISSLRTEDVKKAKLEFSVYPALYYSRGGYTENSSLTNESLAEWTHQAEYVWWSFGTCSWIDCQVYGLKRLTADNSGSVDKRRECETDKRWNLWFSFSLGFITKVTPTPVPDSGEWTLPNLRYTLNGGVCQ